MRVGHGFDVHRFEFDSKKPLKLCGVVIPDSHGLKAHSDGDVAIHSLCDAMLGALAMGDIGRHFPDDNEKYLGFDSADFLKIINRMIIDQQYKIGNLDLTIVAEQPKLSSFIEIMRQRLSDILMIELTQINIKATTTEGLGFVGRKEGIACYAVIVLER